jgi:hypothetical protein
VSDNMAEPSAPPYLPLYAPASWNAVRICSMQWILSFNKIQCSRICSWLSALSGKRRQVSRCGARSRRAVLSTHQNRSYALCTDSIRAKTPVTTTQEGHDIVEHRIPVDNGRVICIASSVSIQKRAARGDWIVPHRLHRAGPCTQHSRSCCGKTPSGCGGYHFRRGIHGTNYASLCQLQLECTTHELTLVL